MSARSIMIMAGGTGGHIMPGLAVADVLHSRGWQVTWLGNPDKMEGRLVPPRGYKLVSLVFQGVRGKGPAALLKLPLSLALAVFVAWRHFDQVRPDVVLGMGGYVAFPGGLVARLRGVPLVVHEQNAVAGTANRLLAQLACAVLTGFPNVLPRGHHVGNPVRREVCSLAEPTQRYATRQGALRMLVLGGSLGAHILNSIVPQALGLLAQSKRPLVKHQSGEQHIDTLRAAYKTVGIKAECVPFIADMAQALGQADLVICRAGAMTVAEVAAAGVAALFVPLPNAIDDHQNVNAAYLSDAQAAWRQPQSEFTAQWLADWLGTVTRVQLNTVAMRARAQARTDSADLIADVCERTLGGKR